MIEPISLVLPDAVQKLLERLESCGFEAYVVGGCVRDALLGQAPKDWDLCTNALPEEICQCFEDCTTLRTGEKHGTITVLWKHTPYEITTYRVDGVYQDCRRPERVSFVRSLEEDLQRRDFTINAMAYHPIRGLKDPYHGREDLQQKRLRCVGEPERRFAEDALRILRGLRFAACYGLEIQREAAAAMKKLAPFLQQIAWERIDTECCKLLSGEGEHAARMLRLFPEVWTVLIPELVPMRNCPQHHPRHRYALWEHTLHVVEAVPPVVSLRFAALLHDCGKPETRVRDEAGVDHFYGHPERGSEIARQVLHRLHADKKRIHSVCTLVQYHDFSLPQTRKAMRRLLHKLGEETVRQLLCLRRADCMGQSPEAYAQEAPLLAQAEQLLECIVAEQDCFQIKDLAVDGRDLMALGIEKGPCIGMTLHQLLELVLEDALCNEREALLAKAEQLMSHPPLWAVPVPDNSDSDTRDKTLEIPHRSS